MTNTSTDYDRLADKDKAPTKPAPAKKAAPRRRAAVKIDIKAKISETLTSIGSMLIITGSVKADPRIVFDGQVLIARADAVAEAVDKIAAENPAVKKALERLFTGSSYAQLAITVAGVAVPIAAAHGLVPAIAAGLFMPEGLQLPKDDQAVAEAVEDKAGDPA